MLPQAGNPPDHFIQKDRDRDGHPTGGRLVSHCHCMFEDSSARKRFLSAPPSVPSAVAALMEPAIAGLTLAWCHSYFKVPFEGPSTALLALLVVLLFPGVNRFGQTGVGVAIDIVLSWAGVLTVLALLGYATGTLADFNSHMLLSWAVATPIIQLLLTQVGTSWLRQIGRAHV